MVHVVARMEIKSGCMEEFLKIMSELVPVVRAEAGCIEYNPCQDIDADTHDKFITIVEAWESEDHLKSHLATRHMAEFRKAVAALRVGNSVKAMIPVC